ncbi:hypothetical protein NDU88_001635 [Pleurodeles waltl]|uniref:Uncharacterized protein n=1 Tax=Pleurodeles waltl TaxID=8319 RepID=A0AAV7UAT5_PLEWA|nr:hypothetical protein NDU88_001635 [Pleurodeles waltl]
MASTLASFSQPTVVLPCGCNQAEGPQPKGARGAGAETPQKSSSKVTLKREARTKKWDRITKQIEQLGTARRGATRHGCDHNCKQEGTTCRSSKAERTARDSQLGIHGLATAASANKHSGQQSRAGSQGQPAGRRDLAATTSTDSTRDSPLGDATRVGQQHSNRGQPNRGDATLTPAIRGLAATQLHMENHGDNQDLDIEEIIKAAREAAATHSKDWILKQIRGDGASEVPTQEGHTGDRPSGAPGIRRSHRARQRSGRGTQAGGQKGDKKEAGELPEAGTPGPSKQAKVNNGD